jgi:hypothetical protein
MEKFMFVGQVIHHQTLGIALAMVFIFVVQMMVEVLLHPLLPILQLAIVALI